MWKEKKDPGEANSGPGKGRNMNGRTGKRVKGHLNKPVIGYFHYDPQGSARPLYPRDTHLLPAGPLTLKFIGATMPFLKFDRRHWTVFKSTDKFKIIATGDIAFS